MAIPNMAMIPSGYKPTKLYSVLPTPEEVGSDVVVNGDFATDTDWDKRGVGTTIGSGICNFNWATNDYILIQNNVIEVAKTYELTYEIVSYTSGNIYNSNGGNLNLRNAIGVYTEYFTPTTVNIAFRSSGGFIGSIDNVSVVEYIADADFTVTRASSATRVNEKGLIETPEFIIGGDLITNGDFSDGATDWVLSGINVSIADGKATSTGSNYGAQFKQTILTTNKVYKLIFDIVDYTSGSIGLESTYYGVQNSFSSVGTHTVIFTSLNQTEFRLYSRNFIGSIDNVSIVEVERENIPRLDYTDGGCPVLLTEPQSTNLMPYSEDFSQWDTIGGTTITSNFGISPDGTQNADRVQMNTGDRLFESNSTPNVSFSVYAKSNSGLTHTINMRDGGGIVTYDMVITDEWQRFDIYLNTTMSNVQFRAFEDNIDVLMWGAQVEELPYATSYMPTYGEIASRASETVSNAGDVNTFNSTEGVLFAEVAALSEETPSSKYISISDDTYDNRLSILYSVGATNGIRAFLRVGGVTQADMSFITSDITALHKVAFKYKENDFSLWIDGVEVATDTSGNTIPPNTLTSLSFDEVNTSAGAFYGKTSQIQVFNTALSDYELELLTSGSTLYDSYEAMRLALNYNIQ